ncbi:AfsR/SARP family transcriptional regulator [Streptomyces xinghaiensis]|uniref:AfsR/SARP family transcriptional regulator n=1 Tax=Streptomyces xinghaiensis TaxID=1038928 RepID=UPI003C2B7DC3
MGRITFKILGPLDVEADGQQIPVGGARQRAILAMLLLSPDRVVSVESLVEVVWPASAPATARNQVAICVAGLRKVFRTKTGATDLIRTEHPGYVLSLGEHCLDLAEFDTKAEAARSAVRSGRIAEANTLVDEAMALWRGRALDGVTGHQIKAAAARLDERRLEILEERAELQLRLGRHRTLVGELAALVQEHPFREQTRARLMLAQYRSGQRADALRLFREGRRLLVEELGIEPGPVLQSMQDMILRDSPALIRPEDDPVCASSAAPPAQLLADIAAFTGRTRELAMLDGFRENSGHGKRAPVVAAITGVAGIGKTALAMHWANRVADRYPDGQLFADLRGYDDKNAPLRPFDALERFLHALGVPDNQLPPDLDSRAALFRSILSGKHVLIVLDNVRYFAQARPLLPGSGRCCVLLTSRNAVDDFTGDFAIQHLPLAPLSDAEATALLSRTVEAERMAAEPEATAQLAELCDRLPLALRIAAARLVAKPHWSVRSLVDRLQDKHRRLDELSPGTGGVRAGFALTYGRLSASAARLYRNLGLLNTPFFPTWAAASLLDTDVRTAESIVEQLAEAQLLEVIPGTADSGVRYRLPGLPRLHAWERAREEESAEDRDGALGRAYGGWLTLAEAAQARLHGSSAPRWSSAPRTELPASLVAELVEDPVAWFESECPAITEVIHSSAGEGRADIAWALTGYASIFFDTLGRLEDWQNTAKAALAAAEAAGDVPGRANMLVSLGSLAVRQGRYAEAEARCRQALRLFRHTAEGPGRAHALRHLALCALARGDLDQAGRHCRRALTALHTADGVHEAVQVLELLARVERESGRPESAVELIAHASTLRGRGCLLGQEPRLFRPAEALRQADQARRAVLSRRHTAAFVRRAGDSAREARSR